MAKHLGILDSYGSLEVGETVEFQGVTYNVIDPIFAGEIEHGDIIVFVDAEDERYTNGNVYQFDESEDTDDGCGDFYGLFSDTLVWVYSSEHLILRTVE